MSMYILVGTVVIRLAWMQLQSLRVRSWRGLVLYPSYAVWYTAVWMSSKPLSHVFMYKALTLNSV